MEITHLGTADVLRCLKLEHASTLFALLVQVLTVFTDQSSREWDPWGEHINKNAGLRFFFLVTFFTMLSSVFQNCSNFHATDLGSYVQGSLGVGQISTTLTTTAANPSNQYSFPVHVSFAKSISSFASSCLNVTNGSASGISGSGTAYDFSVTPQGQGAVGVTVLAGCAQANNGEVNIVSNTLSLVYDSVAPTATLTSNVSSPTDISPISVNVTFSEPVTALTSDSFSVTNGAVVSLKAISSSSYSVQVVPSGPGDVQLTLNAQAVTDLAGNLNPASNTLDWNYTNISPTVMITSSLSDYTNQSVIPLTIKFSSPVVGFDRSKLNYTNATISSFNANGGGNSYTVQLAPTSDGIVTAYVATGVVQDLAGNYNQASNVFSIVYDSTPPRVTLTSTASSPSGTSPFPITAVFNEPVVQFSLAGISVTNATVSGLSGSGTTYTFNVTPMMPGNVTIQTLQGAALDLAGNQSIASAVLNIVYQAATPTPTPTPAAGCPYSGVITQGGTYNIDVAANFPDTQNGGIVDQISIANALACAQTALGNSAGGNGVTVVLLLPKGFIDLSQTLTGAKAKSMKASIDVSNINCVSPDTPNCGITAGQGSNTTNQLILQGAGTDQTTIQLVLNNQNHGKDLLGIYGNNSVNVTFKGITFTSPYMTVTQGTVVSSNNNSVTMDVPTGFPDPGSLIDTANFPDGQSGGSARLLHAYSYYNVGSDPTNYCALSPDKVEKNGPIDRTSIPWGNGNNGDEGLKQLSKSPNRWVIPFMSQQSGAPYSPGQIVGLKSRAGKNVYQFDNAAFITFDTVNWVRRAHGVFAGTTVHGTQYGVLNVTVKNNTVVPESPLNGISPCLSTPDGGPQFGWQLGFPSSGHNLIGNTLSALGDNPISTFDVTASSFLNNTISDSFSQAAINFQFSNALDQPIENGGEGFDICSNPNILTRDILYEQTPGVRGTQSHQIFCP